MKPLTPLQIAERDCIVTTLIRNDYIKLKTARELGIARETLYRKMYKYSIQLKKPAEPIRDGKCGCRVCNPDAWWMIICDDCGNKRCPHASNHIHMCTKSNEPGQAGSVYPSISLYLKTQES